ncbi:alpha/beta hydrolase [Pseudohalocynthiibacter sp. F2068]|jgi:3-oxoadipate enol-lactonase|uniref:alpha/beta fold hydrolase n=1 Tax=Pseudohalocynthiibacter sp. F2068 TaxID=2926418 RepID=UPI001FF2A1F7|nr:alpha/beta hydrolase [Pseudohalocynthiibacter sp. F2068]MCK0101437.1 alpha/beta hydrolase [Pseudohalocynthiibacter sp. F2068]
MPYIDVNGVRIHYSDEGQGEETIIFSHGLLLSDKVFANQIRHLKSKYRCISYDHRGQGKSEVTKDGYDIDTLTTDAIQLIESLEAVPCHFAGLSMGGFIGMRIGFRRPKLLRSLILIDTSADPEAVENLPKYKLLNFVAKWFGLGLVVRKVMPIMFGQSFLNDPNRAEERTEWQNSIAANHKIGITRAVKGVISRLGISEEISQIDLPVLILIGDEDTATTPDKSEKMHKMIKGSQLVRVPKAGHTSPIEEPSVVNSAMSDFLTKIAKRG